MGILSSPATCLETVVFPTAGIPEMIIAFKPVPYVVVRNSLDSIVENVKELRKYHQKRLTS